MRSRSIRGSTRPAAINESTKGPSFSLPATSLATQRSTGSRHNPIEFDVADGLNSISLSFHPRGSTAVHASDALEIASSRSA